MQRGTADGALRAGCARLAQRRFAPPFLASNPLFSPLSVQVGRHVLQNQLPGAPSIAGERQHTNGLVPHVLKGKDPASLACCNKENTIPPARCERCCGCQAALIFYECPPGGTRVNPLSFVSYTIAREDLSTEIDVGALAMLPSPIYIPDDPFAPFPGPQLAQRPLLQGGGKDLPGQIFSVFP